MATTANKRACEQAPAEARANLRCGEAAAATAEPAPAGAIEEPIEYERWDGME